MTGSTGLLETFPSMAAFHSSYFQKVGGLDCCLLTIPDLQRPPEGGEALVTKIPLGYGVFPSTPVLITCSGVLFRPVLSTAAPAMIYCTTGNWSAWGTCTNPALMIKYGLLFTSMFVTIRGAKTEIYLLQIPIIRLLNNFLWVSLLLV